MCISASCIKIKINTLSYTLLCGISEGFMKAFKTFVISFEAPERNVKINIFKLIFSLHPRSGWESLIPVLRLHQISS